MMRRSCVYFAVCVAALVSAGSHAVTVNEGEDLAAAITNAAAGDTIQLKSASGSGASWPLTAPVTVTQTLTIQGEAGLLPIRSIIEGNSAAGTCNGNVVGNGDFEGGATSDWIANPTTPSPFVNDTGQAASGDWFARLTLDPCASPTGLAADVIELRYLPLIIPSALTLGAPEAVRWNPIAVVVQPSTVLNVWLKIHAPAPGGETLTFTLHNNNGTDHVLTLDGAGLAAESNGDLWKQYKLPLTALSPPPDPLDVITSLQIEAVFPVKPDPTVVLIGAVEFSDSVLTVPGAGVLDFALATLSGAYQPLVNLAVPAYGNSQAVRLGGLMDPRFLFSVRAETPQPSDKLELELQGGAPAEWSDSAAALASAGCVQVSVPLSPGPSVLPVFRATILPPPAASGPVTRFILDDMALTYFCDWLFAQVKGASLLLEGDIENIAAAASHWSVVTPCAFSSPPLDTARYVTSPGCGGAGSALLLTRETGAASAVSLSQFVTFPASGTEMRFKLKVGQPGGPESTFKFEVDGTVMHTAESSDAALAAGWKEIILPYPAAWHSTGKTLRFSAELAEGIAPPSFLLDDVCIGLPPAGPVLTVANSATLRLENLMVTNGTAGVAVTDTASLEFVRCAVQSVTGPGLYFSAQGKGTAANSIFTGCSGPAVLSDSTGTVTVYQCTAKGNTDGIKANSGPLQLVASIIEDGNVAGQAFTWLNLIRGSFPAAYEQSGYENLASGTVVEYLDSPWIGKLQPTKPVLSGHTIVDADTVTGKVSADMHADDFEGDARSEVTGQELQVGADQEGGLGEVAMWLSCSVSPAVVGRGKPVTITVTTQGIDLNLASLRIVPEEPLAGMTGAADPYIRTQCYEIPLGPGMTGDDSSTVSVTFSDPCNWRSVMNTALCTEGVNSVYLNDGTGTDPDNPMLYGNGRPGLTDPGVGGCTFLVDTTPPTLLVSSGGGDATAGQPRIYTANDTLTGTGLPGLQGTYAVPASDGTVVDRAVHCMLNASGNGTCADTAAAGTLTFGIEALFEDRPPAPLTHVTTSGFQSGNTTNLTDKQDGGAWLEGPLGPVTNTTADCAADMAANVGRLTAHFTGEAAQSVPDPWRFEGRPGARDRAGNETVAPNGLVLWWMWRARAEITGGPRDSQTLNPRFDWRLRRNITGPDAAEAAPIVPYVKAKLWRGSDPAADRNITAMAWEPVTAWSGWLSGPITTETVIAGSSLGTWLKNNQADTSVSHTLMLTVVGADEAGNIQPAGYADNPLVTVADLDASCVSYTWWYNGQSQDNVSVDTEARVVMLQLVPGAPTRMLGNVTRVPLPPEGQALQASARMTARLPESVRAHVLSGDVGVARAWIKWTLYEDGSPVASGGNESAPLAGTDFIEILLPANPAAADSYVLGDMKNRKREKRYVLTAQTVLKTYTVSGGLTQERVVSDPSPASVSFTVYPKEMDDKIRDERPTRIYERE